MNQTNRPKFIQPLVLSLLLSSAISACNTAKTSSSAPDTTATNATTTPATTNTATTADAQSDLRQRQLDADIRAREQRNNIMGDPLKRADSDLASEVRSKLEANIFNSKLAINSENAIVTISGAVANQADLDKIKPLALQIKGVKNVLVKAIVTPVNQP